MTRTALQNVSSTRILAAILILAAGQVAIAETETSDYRYEFAPPTSFYQPTPPLPVEMGFSQHHSSTAAEGFLRGKAAVIQAIGNFQLAKGQAAILFQQGRALDRENDPKQTQALHAQQAMWREARAAKRAERDARIAEGQAKLTVRRATVHRQAYQLSPTELNLVTGEIRWPSALQAAKYRPQREQMQELFRMYVSYGGEGQPGIAEGISRVSESLAHPLRSDIGSLTRDDYVAAQKFLLGLKLEAEEV